MTKLRLAIGGAAVAAAFVLPAAPASAECWSLFTTPVECVKEAVAVDVVQCHYLGTFIEVCIPATGA